MATVSSHILDSVSGKSAAGIRSQLFQLVSDTEKQLVFDVSADREGRIAEAVVIDDANIGCEFELVFHGAEYFKAQGLDSGSMVKTVVIRFAMTDDQQRYHLPVMLAPHSYSTWWSGQP
jgi:5-hydroxyisourate hydrolase